MLLRLLEPFGIVLVDYKVLDTFDAEVGEGSEGGYGPIHVAAGKLDEGEVCAEAEAHTHAGEA